MCCAVYRNHISFMCKFKRKFPPECRAISRRCTLRYTFCTSRNMRNGKSEQMCSVRYRVCTVIFAKRLFRIGIIYPDVYTINILCGSDRFSTVHLRSGSGGSLISRPTKLIISLNRYQKCSISAGPGFFRVSFPRSLTFQIPRIRWSIQSTHISSHPFSSICVL